MTKTWDPSQAEAIVRAHAKLEGPLLPILHALNAEYGCIPEAATPLIAEALNLSRAEVHGVISFYHDFRREPAGRIVVRLCRAEACQAMGGRELGETVLRHFKLGWGDTNGDRSVTIEPVYCLGLCAAAPAALVNGAPSARVEPARLIADIEAMR
mgnify:CR=1 FL=1